MRTYKSRYLASLDSNGISEEIPVPALATRRAKQVISKISPTTKLVSAQGAVDQLFTEKGYRIAVKTLKDYCRSGKLISGYHWLKVNNQYLFNMEAIYQTLFQ